MWFGSLHQARERLVQWRDHYNLQRPHSALNDRTPASFAHEHASPAACFAPIEPNTASCGPRQGFASPAKNAALDPVPRLPENAKYRGETLFQMANARGSLLSLWSELHARQSSSGKPHPPKSLVADGTEIRGASRTMISYTETDGNWGQVTAMIAKVKSESMDPSTSLAKPQV